MIRYGIFLAAGLPLTAVFSLVSVAGGAVRAPAGLHDWVHRTWSRALLTLAGVRLEVDGLEHLEPGVPQVLMSNHQSLLDILALFAGLPVSLRFVAKEELRSYPVFGAAMRRAGHVFIDRSNRAAAVRVMRRAGRRMEREGLTLGLFPEGTRSPPGELRRFKRGPFALAIETGARLVPVAVEGGGRLLPKGQRRLEPGTMRIRCGPPLQLEALAPEDRDRVLERTRRTIADMLRQLRAATTASNEGGGEEGLGAEAARDGASGRAHAACGRDPAGDPEQADASAG